MSKRIVHIIFLITLQLCCSDSYTQKLFHQDIFYGGVTAGGVSGGMGTGTFDLKLHIEPNSTIRNAYLFAYTVQAPKYVPYTINGKNYFIDTTNVVMISEFPNPDFNIIKLYYNNVTDEFSQNITTDYTITIPEQHNIGLNEGWWAVYVYVEYDNPNLTKTATSLWINDLDYNGHEIYSMKNMNTIDLNYPIGLSLMSDRSCDSIYDGTKVYLNSNYIGLIGGSDWVNANATCGGTKGHFYYQNNQLYGLDDDTPNAIMGETDALADISPYLFNGNSYQLHLEYQGHNVYTSFNPYFLFINAYSTPCDTFTTSIIKDTAICQDEQIELITSGGVKYSWYPTIGLSDTTISNPMANPKKTTLYQVRIENTLGCSKTEKVLVKVNERPQIKNLNIQETVCGTSTGNLVVNTIGNNPLEYSLSDTFQTNKVFSNLGGGNYTLIVKDTNGCKVDTMINIPIKNNVHAYFTATPQTGAKPLAVDFNNQSENAVNYQWLMNGVLLSNNENEHYTFDSSGVYTITLIAWNNDISCTDTFKLQIMVYDSLIVQIPNVFTPNDDNVNDIFTIKVEGCKQLKGAILNRWGEPLTQFDKTLSQSSEIIDLWDGKTNDGIKATEGVYFYKIEMIDFEDNIKEINGFFHLVR
ncbi:MAG TPA: gliding motility-associated C-terminal domain-containing protein [Crocinitomicaceae bacterium]|nr:gliding motility-associated C-terminal domain-containing protein [Crocinitomicaceae bacterium]